MNTNFEINKDSVIGEIIERYPYIKDFMPTLSEDYKLLQDPEAFKTMAPVATLEMVAAKGGLEVDFIIEKIKEKIQAEENK